MPASLRLSTVNGFSFKTKKITSSQWFSGQRFLVVLHGTEELPAHSVHPGVGGGEEAFHEANVASVRGHCQHCEGVALALGKWESCLCSEEDISSYLHN